MDTSNISSLATSLSQSRTADAVHMAMLKKSMDLNAQNGMQLIQAATQPVASNPWHLGSRIDLFA